MELDNAVEQGNRLKRLIEHEDLIILSANDRQGLKKAMDRKRKYVQKLKKLEVEEMEKEGKNVAEGQLTMYNYKLAEIAHELDKVDVNELTPIEALNTLVKIKEKMSS